MPAFAPTFSGLGAHVLVVSLLLLPQVSLSQSAGNQSDIQQNPVVVENNEPANVPVADTGADKPVSTSRGWRNFFTSARERRRKLAEQGEFDRLTEDTGDGLWSAAGNYRRQQFEEAADAYAALEGEVALYNEATTLAQIGEYDESLARFDQLLADNPGHSDALHNREIVEKLKELNQRQQQQQGQESSDSSEDQDESERDEQDNQSQQRQSDGESANDRDQSSSQQNSAANQESQASQGDSAESQTESGNASNNKPPDLEQMKQASQSDKELQELERQKQNALQQLAQEAPLTEEQQATEQWLRQIPDDPSGLLRRKLERSHSMEYPEITNSKQPW